MFSTPEVTSIYAEIKPLIGQLLISINGLDFDRVNEITKELNERLSNAKDGRLQGAESVLDELYILNRLADMLAAYSSVWSRVFKSEFSSSWDSLQDALDLVSKIKRLSGCVQDHLLDYFENQLVELEKLYPYNVFFSVGIVVDRFKCSICSKDIDSFDCPHTAGELYGGQMAHGIAQNITKLDHVAMVKHPEDRRCVAKYDDDGPQFKPIRFLSDLIKSRKVELRHFGKLEFSKKTIENPDFRRMGRNERCFCGSGKKFKKCCIDKALLETDHIDIVARPVNMNEVLA